MLATATNAAETPTNICSDATPQVRVEYTNVEDFLVDYTSNETIGGMFIKTERPMSVGTAFSLRFQLPGGRRPIEARAEVRWTLPRDVAAPMSPGMGVRFERLSTIDRGIVEHLLQDWR
jgi:type IV pilus assembly protein PilZ